MKFKKSEPTIDSDPDRETDTDNGTDTGTNEAGGEQITDQVNLFIVIPITNLRCVVYCTVRLYIEWTCYVSVLGKYVIHQNFQNSPVRFILAGGRRGRLG